jgi:hypothetical protein
MNEAMKKAWLEISQMLGEPTREELDVFLRTWQRAIQAEREACARVCESLPMQQEIDVRDECAAAIRNRGNT